MKEFFQKIIIIAVPILIVLISVNYFVDAAKIFDENYENRIAKILLKGEYATNIRNYNERTLQEILVKQMTYTPEVLVVGSSRTMLIDSSFFKGEKFFNSSVSGASLQDLIAIFEIYSSFEKIPEKIILGIDPWTFQQNKERNRWEAISAYYYKFKGKSNHSLSTKYEQIISVSYFQASWKRIPSLWSDNALPYSTQEILNETNTILNDGSLSYGKEFRSASISEVDTRAKQYSSGELTRRYQNYKTMSPDKIAEFKYFINHLKEKNIEVEFFLGPYHPTTYEQITRDFDIFYRVESFVKDFAKNQQINVYGSFNPQQFNLDGSFFYDEKHMNKTGFHRVFL